MNEVYILNQDGDLLIDFTKQISLLKGNNFIDLIVKGHTNNCFFVTVPLDNQILAKYGTLIDGKKPETAKSFMKGYETRSDVWKQAKRFICLKRCKGYNLVGIDCDSKGVMIDSFNIKQQNEDDNNNNNEKQKTVNEVGSIKYPINRISSYFPQNRVDDNIMEIDLYKMQKPFSGVFVIQERLNETIFVQIELLKNCLKIIQGADFNFQKAKIDIIRYKSNEEAQLFGQKILHDLVAVGYKRNYNYFQQSFTEKDLEKK